MLVLVYPNATYIRASSHASCPEFKPSNPAMVASLILVLILIPAIPYDVQPTVPQSHLVLS